MNTKPPVLRNVTLYTAGRDLVMSGLKVGPVSFVIGSQIFNDNEIYVAPVENEMLLGLDFLQNHEAVINMSNGSLEIGLQRITMSANLINDLSTVRVAKVSVAKRTIVPPCSMPRLPCRLSCPMAD
jgi:hypothetical protein